MLLNEIKHLNTRKRFLVFTPSKLYGGAVGTLSALGVRSERLLPADIERLENRLTDDEITMCEYRDSSGNGGEIMSDKLSWFDCIGVYTVDDPSKAGTGDMGYDDALIDDLSDGTAIVLIIK